jgi:uncharacterized protein YbjQ (UPF0145 family)
VRCDWTCATPTLTAETRRRGEHDDQAAAKGADAVLAMRFDATEIGGGWQEICAYGTAVRTRPLI